MALEIKAAERCPRRPSRSARADEGGQGDDWDQDGSALADELLHRIGQAVGDRAKAATVFGESVEREGITVIPVAKARFGFGAGGGAWGRGRVRWGWRRRCVGVSPAGYTEVRDGTATFKRISSPVDLVGIVAAVSLAVLALRVPSLTAPVSTFSPSADTVLPES